jgi:DNA gyrase inhibitor GyrI
LVFVVDEFTVRLERLEPLTAICAYALSDTPEEDAKEKIMNYANSKELIGKTSVSRLFGRNTYPTQNPEPHGYEIYLTTQKALEPEGDLEASEISGGLYAVLRFKSLFNIAEAWANLLKWVEKSPHDHVGWTKGNHGWVGGFEEHINWKDEKPPTEWVFKLWVKLKE